jgi:Fe-S cluster assembly iron-binding protein IscA
MFQVTEKATEMIREFLKDREEIPHIRIMMSGGG